MHARNGKRDGHYTYVNAVGDRFRSRSDVLRSIERSAALRPASTSVELPCRGVPALPVDVLADAPSSRRAPDVVQGEPAANVQARARVPRPPRAPPHPPLSLPLISSSSLAISSQSPHLQVRQRSHSSHNRAHSHKPLDHLSCTGGSRRRRERARRPSYFTQQDCNNPAPLDGSRAATTRAGELASSARLQWMRGRWSDVRRVGPAGTGAKCRDLMYHIFSASYALHITCKHPYRPRGR